MSEFNDIVSKIRNAAANKIGSLKSIDVDTYTDLLLHDVPTQIIAVTFVGELCQVFAYFAGIVWFMMPLLFGAIISCLVSKFMKEKPVIESPEYSFEFGGD